MFAFAAHHKSSYILQKHQRDFFLVTIQNETCGFIGTIAINHTTQLHFAFLIFYHQTLIGNNTYSPTINSCIATNNCFAIIFFKFIQAIRIYNTINNIEHIIGFGIPFALHTINFFDIFNWIFRFCSVKSSIIYWTKFIHYFFHLIQTILLCFEFIICNTRNFGVGNGTA